MKYPMFVIAALLIQCSENKNLALEKIARERVEAMSRHDIAALAALFSDSARVESVGFDVPRKGPAGVREAYQRYFATSPDLKYEITYMVAGEHSVVVEYTSAGTMNSPEKGEPDYMAGKKYVLRNCTRMDVENGKIVREMTYFDQVAFLRQVGFFEHLTK